MVEQGGIRVNVYLTPAAAEKRKKLDNFSAWVNRKLLSDDGIEGGGQDAILKTQPAIKENFCVSCNAWSPTMFCPVCGRKTILKGRIV